MLKYWTATSFFNVCYLLLLGGIWRTTVKDYDVSGIGLLKKTWFLKKYFQAYTQTAEKLLVNLSTELTCEFSIAETSRKFIIAIIGLRGVPRKLNWY